jgi:hypothetical protein
MIRELDKIDLERPFSEDEIRVVVFSSYSEGFPGLMASILFFIRKFGTPLRGISVAWSIISLVIS